MLTERDVYYIWRKAKEKPFKMPKDWQAKWFSFKPEEQEYLKKMVRHCATTWQNINLENYFKCGYEIFWKGFPIIFWFKPEIMNLYIKKSKNKKRIEEDIKQALINSLKFVLNFCKTNHIYSLRDYARIRNNQKLICLEHFMKDYVSKWLIVFLLQKKFALFEPEDWELIPFDQEKFREMKMNLREINYFTVQMEQIFKEKINAS